MCKERNCSELLIVLGFLVEKTIRVSIIFSSAEEVSDFIIHAALNAKLSMEACYVLPISLFLLFLKAF